MTSTAHRVPFSQASHYAVNKSSYVNASKSVLEGRRPTSTKDGKPLASTNRGVSNNSQATATTTLGSYTQAARQAVTNQPAQSSSIREPNKSASSTGVGMYTKDFPSSH